MILQLPESVCFYTEAFISKEVIWKDKDGLYKLSTHQRILNNNVNLSNQFIKFPIMANSSGVFYIYFVFFIKSTVPYSEFCNKMLKMELK